MLIEYDDIFQVIHYFEENHFYWCSGHLVIFASHSIDIRKILNMASGWTAFIKELMKVNQDKFQSRITSPDIKQKNR